MNGSVPPEGDLAVTPYPADGDLAVKQHFGDREGIGAQMAVRASVGLEDAAAIAISCEALARRLLGAWK